MPRRVMPGKVDQALGRLQELEGRLLRLEGQLKVLQGRARRARGTARIRLGRLERQAAEQVARVAAALEASRSRVSEVIDVGRRRVERLMRSVEPGLERSLDRARQIGATGARLSAAVRVGVKAGRKAFRGSRNR